jgi:catechol 2,3-dioxygenase
MIGTVQLRVSSLRRAISFYRDLLGLRVIAPGVLAASEHGPALIALTELSGATKPGRTTGLYHVAIRVSDAPALGRLLARLLAADYPLQGASDHPTNKAIYLADPDGNGIELTIDNPRDQWFGPDGQLRLESPPLDGHALLAAAGPAPWAAIDPKADIGHIHLHVADLERSIAFYRDVVGLEVKYALPRFRAAFLAVGDYHHHLGLNTWNGASAPRPASDAVGLQSYTIVVPDAPDGDRVLVDPDGNQVRVTADMPQMAVQPLA